MAPLLRRVVAGDVTALLIDIGDVPECACNDAIGDLFKALAEPSADSPDIWRPVENPYLSAHVEDVTRRFQALIAALQEAFTRALAGQPLDLGSLAKSDPVWLRWDEAAFLAVRERLESKPSALYDLDDWLTLADYLIHRYLPDGVIQTEADYLTVRAALAGKIQATIDAQASAIHPDMATAAVLIDLVPTTFRAIPERVLTQVETATLAVARARAAENISDLVASTRHRMKRIIIEHVQAQVLGQPEGLALKQVLLDSFGTLNRDFRRIAVTEAGEACNQGFITAQRPGQQVRRQEAYRGACPFCKAINGKVYTVVDPAKPAKNGETEVWTGKTNIGRSAAPRKRAGGFLVEREPHERWWPAAGLQHPHCRGSWSLVSKAPPNVSPQFASWLDAKLASVMRLPATEAS